jgi:hypothetical protein
MRNAMSESRAWPPHLAPLSLIVAASLLATIPVFRFGIPFGMDAPEHLSWYRCFITQLSAGELYPRWLQGMNGGLGSPDLFVYGPLPYYAAAVFHVFDAHPGHEVYDLGWSIVAALVLAGTTAYFWLRRLVGGRLVPAAGALVYLGVPYYLKTDLYTRSALAEFWAFAWMPLILCCAAALLERRSRAALAGLGAGWALLFTTHLFTAMILAPLFLLYPVFLARPGERLTSVATFASAMLLGAALAAVYLFPALAHERFIAAYRLIETRPDYRFDRNFLFSAAIATPYLASLSRFTAWTAAVAALFSVTVFMAKPGLVRRESQWWAGVAAGSLLLMHPAGAWFWWHLPLLSAIQFPSRLNVLLTLATAALAAAALASLRARWEWRQAAPAMLALVLAAGWIPALVHTMRNQNFRVQQAGAVNLDYLITAWAQWTDPKILSLRGIPLDSAAPRVAPERGGAEVRRWEPRLIEFQIASPAESWVKVKQFYFPGWTASTLDGRALAVGPSSPEGLMMVRVPAGTSNVTLRLSRGMPEVAGGAVSALAALFLGLLFMPWRWFRRQWRAA